MDTKGTGKMNGDSEVTLDGQLAWTIRVCDLGDLHLALLLDGEAMVEVDLTPEEASRLGNMLLDNALRVIRERTKESK
jgi:hypothetical protein